VPTVISNNYCKLNTHQVEKEQSISLLKIPLLET